MQQIIKTLIIRGLLTLTLCGISAYSAYISTLILYQLHKALESNQSSLSSWACNYCTSMPGTKLSWTCSRCRLRSQDVSIRSQMVYDTMINILNDQWNSSLAYYCVNNSICHYFILHLVDLCVYYYYLIYIVIIWVYFLFVVWFWSTLLFWPKVAIYIDMKDRKVGFHL